MNLKIFVQREIPGVAISDPFMTRCNSLSPSKARCFGVVFDNGKWVWGP